jgi:hypothetical protein
MENDCCVSNKRAKHGAGKHTRERPVYAQDDEAAWSFPRA